MHSRRPLSRRAWRDRLLNEDSRVTKEEVLAPFTSSAHEQPTIEGFQFPSWDQLPEDLQNPTSSADFDSTIPITTTGVESTDTLPWDDMDFAMDLDTDMDMGLNQI
jgi:hypothetical protein